MDTQKKYMQEQEDVAKETVENMKNNMMDSIRNAMIKEVVDNIKYYSEKLEENRLKLKVLQNGAID